jgi:hypothetical protein
MKMEQSVPETSTYKIQTPGNYPEENVQQIMNCFNYINCLYGVCFDVTTDQSLNSKHSVIR